MCRKKMCAHTGIKWQMQKLNIVLKVQTATWMEQWKIRRVLNSFKQYFACILSEKNGRMIIRVAATAMAALQWDEMFDQCVRHVQISTSFDSIQCKRWTKSFLLCVIFHWILAASQYQRIQNTKECRTLNLNLRKQRSAKLNAFYLLRTMEDEKKRPQFKIYCWRTIASSTASGLLMYDVNSVT